MTTSQSCGTSFLKLAVEHHIVWKILQEKIKWYSKDPSRGPHFTLCRNPYSTGNSTVWAVSFMPVAVSSCKSSLEPALHLLQGQGFLWHWRKRIMEALHCLVLKTSQTEKINLPENVMLVSITGNFTWH